jgi:serine/threonine protein kinase
MAAHESHSSIIDRLQIQKWISRHAPKAGDWIVDQVSQHMLQELRKDHKLVLHRGEHQNKPGSRSVLLLVSVFPHTALERVSKLKREYSLKDELDSEWAVRPLDLSDHRGQMTLVLEDSGGEPLDRLISGKIETPQFLRLGIGLAKALGSLHKEGLIHNDVKAANVLRLLIGARQLYLSEEVAAEQNDA